jgi:hypothetical protein
MRRALLLLLLAVPWSALPVLAADAAEDPVPAPPAEAEEAPDDAAPPEDAPAPTTGAPFLGHIRGSRVNVRVGPRIGGRVVTQLDDGEAVLVVERLPGWVGVRIPRGFQAALSDEYLQVIDPDTVRVDADRLTLRLDPPTEEGGPPGAAFRDTLGRGAELVRIDAAGAGWSWIVAPEAIRAYVHTDYVDVGAGPPPPDDAGLAAARARRTAWIAALHEARIETKKQRADAALRDGMGAVQEALYRARLDGGHDRAPIVALVNRMEDLLADVTWAPPPLVRVAQALREDLEGELTLRVARRDAAVARARGLDPGPDPLPAPEVSQVRLTGVLRWEPIPAWRTGGAWILWTNERPTHVVRLTAGMPLPHPDLKALAGSVHTYVGRQPGERLFGLPVVDLTRAE